MIGRLLLLLGVSLLAGCVTPTVYDNDLGELKGQLFVVWDGEDNFVFYPAPGDPLRYRLPQSIRNEIGVAEIVPGVMYTDGGSIPSAFRSLAGFSPWGYAPAYMVHDWIFAVHHCVELDDKAGLAAYVKYSTPAQIEAVRRTNFQQSANILGNIIFRLIKDKRVEAHGVAPDAIYTAVDSVVARNLWNSQDRKGCAPVPEEKIRDIEAAVAGHISEQNRQGRSFVNTFRFAPRSAAPAVAGKARVILQQSF